MCAWATVPSARRRLDRGALPRLEVLDLADAAIGDAALAALAPARRRPARNISTSVATRSATRASPLAAAGACRHAAAAGRRSEEAKVLYLGFTRISDAGCAALAAALDGGALPTVEELRLYGTPPR